MRVTFLAFLLVLISRSTGAGPNADGRIALHVVSSSAASPCFSGPSIPGCFQLESTERSWLPPPAEFTVYVLVEQADSFAGVGGASFGVGYDATPGFGVDILDWTLCADLESPAAGWPASGSGNTVSWNSGNCQHNVPSQGYPEFEGTACVGYFTVAAYSPSLLQMTPHPGTGTASLLDCSGTMDILTGFPSRLGFIGFRGVEGYNPCDSYFQSFRCTIIGPDISTPGSIDTFYCYIPFNIRWTISGNGSIVGPSDESSVIVQAGAPGSFRLDFLAFEVDQAIFCHKDVTVDDSTPVELTSWGRIKAIYGAR